MSTSASFLLPDATQPAVVNDAPPRTPLVHVARQLLPPGRAFSQRADSVTGLLLEGMVEELQAAENLVHSLALEPVTSPMLSTWTEALGIDSTLEESAQRAAILRNLRGESEGTARADYDAAALAVGLLITELRTYGPFEAGTSRAGDPVRGDAWLHAFELGVVGAAMGDAYHAHGVVRMEGWAFVPEENGVAPLDGIALEFTAPNGKKYRNYGAFPTRPNGSSWNTGGNGSDLDAAGNAYGTLSAWRAVGNWWAVNVLAAEPGPSSNLAHGTPLAVSVLAGDATALPGAAASVEATYLIGLGNPSWFGGPNTWDLLLADEQMTVHYPATGSIAHGADAEPVEGSAMLATAEQVAALQRIIDARIKRAHTLVRVFAAHV